MEMEKRVDALESKVNNMDKDFAVFNSVVGRLADTQDKLNTTIENLNITLVSLQAETKQNSEGVKDLKTQLEKNDNEHNLNVVEWIKNNFVVLIMALVLMAHTFGFIK